MKNLFTPNRLVFFEGAPGESFVPDSEKVTEHKSDEALKFQAKKAPESFEGTVEAYLTQIDADAKRFEDKAKEGKFFAFGNLGDSWIPSIDGLSKLLKGKVDSADGMYDKHVALREARCALHPVVTRLERYLKQAEGVTKQVDAFSWDRVKDFRASLGMKPVDMSDVLIRGDKFDIDSAASEKESLFDKEGRYFQYGNLGDNWIPLIDNLVGRYERKYSEATDASKKEGVIKEAKTEVGLAVHRLAEYLRRVEAKTGERDEQSWVALRGIMDKLKFDKVKS
ncbi:MAG: hypothetical protein US89_C0017G0008 [Candidatus Peregrinibacteria bacterium GW2011_GWF2_38_29]|nr:MAG: hypothetical protein US89_C0017G0008 [Candidatus Peregrinibacteria bacterium GW2011_GWF2_38_29]HBB02560.1 hypothetical protein [Candidatus Peregrinibacteria bacterium]